MPAKHPKPNAQNATPSLLTAALLARLHDKQADIKRTFHTPLTFAPQISQLENALQALPQKAYDVILAPTALVFAENPPDALLRLGRALQPDGLLLACTLGPGSFEQWRELRDESCFAPLPDIRDVGVQLTKLRFALPVVDKTTLSFTFTSLAKATRFLQEEELIPRLIAPFDAHTQAEQEVTFTQAWHSTSARKEDLLPLTLDILSLHAWRPGPGQPKPLAPGSAKVSLGDVLNTSS